jgi:regulator of nonsense transcripts 3
MTSEAYLLGLEEAVRRSTFEDASNTFNSPSLIGLPTVEFAPYSRTPGGRRRTDARAGTIDQDPEFMAFLEGLANPTTSKEANDESLIDATTSKSEKVTTTPLVQFLKDKKASKNKESAAKAAKKQELQLAKGKSIKETTSSVQDGKKKGKDLKPDRAVEKAAKEAVKILNREAATKSGSTAASGSGEVPASRKLDLSNVPAGRRSMVVAKHIKMLQRDLGLTHAQAHRQLGRDTADARKAEQAAAAAKAGAESKAESSDAAQAPIVPTAPKASTIQANARRPRGKAPELETSKLSSIAGSSPATASPRTPMVLLKKPETPQTTPTAPISQPAKPPQAPASRKPQSAAVPSEGATQAFVKHANASQGVTEALLKEAMENFGAVSMVEIDRKKGFAYVDFIDPDGLKKAMAANPISVAQGTVQVLQRKGIAAPPKPPHQAPHAPRGGGGGRGGGRGGTVGRRGGRGGARGGGITGGSCSATPTEPAAKG